MSQTPNPPLFELTAVRVKGPAPLGDLEVPIRSGLNALYGRNGAGKTRLLAAVQDVVSGQRNLAEVVVRVCDEARVAQAAMERHGKWRGDGPHSDLQEHYGSFPWRSDGGPPLNAVVGDVLIERWVWMEKWSGWGSGKEGRPSPVDVVDEVLKNMSWVLRSTHDGGKTRWEVTVAIRFSENTPLLSRHRQRVFEEWCAFMEQLPEQFPEAGGDESEEFVSKRAEAVERFGERLHPRDFFTVLGPLPYPTEFEEYDHAIDELMKPGALVYIDTLFDNVITGPLCGVRTDEVLLDFEDLPGATVAALRAWSFHERVARRDPKDDESNDWWWLDEGLPMIESGDPGIHVASWVSEQVEVLVGSVNALLQSMLPESPVLECSLAKPERWVDEAPCRWSAKDPTGANVSLSQLSGAQTRLIRLAATLTLGAYTRQFESAVHGVQKCGPELVLLDEPEAGLHRLAEDKLTEALDDYGRRNNMAIVAATHSSSFLRNPRVALVEVFRRGDGWTSARGVEFPEKAGADALGISRADLLQLNQLILLVEGQHEMLIFGEMLGRELGRRRVLMVPLRGMFNLKAIVDLEILAHTLEHPVLAVLDNSNAPAIDGLWAGLRGLPPGVEADGVYAELERCLGPKNARTDEEMQIAGLAFNLQKSGQLDRFEVFGLSRRDVIEYMPVERLVPGAASWEELRAEHEQQRREAPEETTKDFKKWLTETHHADFGTDALVLAAGISAETPPDEFLLLLARIDSIVCGWTR